MRTHYIRNFRKWEALLSKNYQRFFVRLFPTGFDFSPCLKELDFVYYTLILLIDEEGGAENAANVV